MDRLEAMALLVKIVERGSLSGAGRELGIPLATVSRKISSLEAALGTRLLTRTTRKLTLTDTGLAYVDAARRILEEVDIAEREAAGEFMAPRGELVLAAPLMFGRLHVLPVISDFLLSYPEINIRLALADRNVDLVGEHVDMAVRIGKLSDSSMVATQVGVMRTVTCASPALLTHYTPKTPADLRQLPSIAVDSPQPSSLWRFSAGRSGKTVEISIRPRLSVTSTQAAVDAAVRSVGVVRLLHYQAAEAVDRGELRIILEAYESPAVPIHLLHATRGQMPLKMRSFIDFAVPRLRQGLEQLKPIRR
jgi:DNA-binding transcriptional LysR family regulator